MSRLHPDELRFVQECKNLKYAAEPIKSLVAIIERLDIPLGRPRSVNEKSHGITMYGIGCRCSDCRKANAAYSKRYREKRKAELRAKL